MVSDAVRWRLRIAERVAAGYRADPQVAVVLVAGSVARGLADELSDIELDIYWSSAPSDGQRTAAMESADWEWLYTEVDEHEWADGIMADGVKIDVSGFTIATIDSYISRVLAGDTDPELQVRVTALRDGHVLHGIEVVDAWRQQVAKYPECLAVAMIERGLSLRARERLEMLARRDDVVLLHRDVVDGVQGVMDALFGLNRVWCPHPHHKWLDWEATLLPVKPAQLVDRIRILLNAKPTEVVSGLGSLVDETLDLCEKHIPAVDVAKLRHAFDTRRTTGLPHDRPTPS
ncbi:DUF4037 domain-containing protein [Mycobacteroides abscessus]|uniref:DUF4037 domain-containing protein n=1 Tax=Mycobacteroides abscessus TaxID=36809 RepID=UPI0013000D20|nr:DUF4037 domain-containing protein [Mycobacteroides abscessus]